MAVVKGRYLRLLLTISGFIELCGDHHKAIDLITAHCLAGFIDARKMLTDKQCRCRIDLTNKLA
ncbi:Uncharacterised protein [Vibrio cholerae]|nr:Uncharacterised protein [Vibrio cholerae]